MRTLHHLFFAVAVATAAVAADQEKYQPLRATAQSLDELVSPRPADVVVFSQGKSFTQKGPSFDITRASPVLAEMLKIEQPLLESVLQKGKPTLSQITYARVLEAKTNKPWQKWARKSEKDLLREMERQAIPLDAVHSILKNMYNEVAFLSLDTFTETDRKRKVSSR